jgi:serine/threonine-protein kinase ULK2
MPNSDPTHQKNPDETLNDGDVVQDTETLREKMIKIFKNNSSRLLHERNKYVFLASVAEDAISYALIPKYNLSEMVGFILIKKLFYMIGDLKLILEEKENIYALEEWDDYIGTKDFSKIYVYISKEYDVFKVYYDSMHENVKKNSEKNNFENDIVAKSLSANTKAELQAVFNETLLKYTEYAMAGIQN